MLHLASWESSLVRLAGTLLSRRGRNASLLVLIFHRVLQERDPLLPNEPDARQFGALVDLIAGNFNILPLREAADRLRRGALPSRAICITFDDGYANNCTVALPILAARRVPATVFVAPGFLNGKRMFNDTILETIRRAPEAIDLTPEGLTPVDFSQGATRLQIWEKLVGKLKYLEPVERLRRVEALAERLGVTLPTDLMMTDDQVRTLHRSGIEIGAHTMTHPILTRVDAETALREMSDSRRRLEEITGAPVRSFAYPNGRPKQDYDHKHVGLAREAGFDLALTTAWGAATIDSDMLQIPRVAPWDATGLRYGARLANAYRQRRYETV
jgi:peptidoglycan/xylan/chitin deacetylase (PgdA/CDA1 family)